MTITVARRQKAVDAAFMFSEYEVETHPGKKKGEYSVALDWEALRCNWL